MSPAISIDWEFFGRMLRRERVQTLAATILLLVPTAARLARADAQAQYLALSVYALAAAILVFSVWRTGNKFYLPQSFLALAAYIVLLLLLVPRAPIMSHAWESLIDYLLLLALAIGLTTALTLWIRAKALLDALLALALLFSAANLIYVLTWLIPYLELAVSPGPAPPFGYRLPGGFLGHSNLEAGYLGLVMPLAWIRLLQADRLIQKLAWSASIALFSVVLFFTSSRAGWAATAFGVAAATALWLLTRREARDVRRLAASALGAIRRRLPAAITVFGLSLLLFGLLWIQASNTPHAPLTEARAHTWAAGVTIFQQSPWIGHGPGAPRILVAAVDRLLSERYFIHPHNLPLYVLGEAGLVGFGVLALGISAFGMSVLRRWRRSTAAERTGAAAALGALASAALHNQADVLTEAPLYAIALTIIMLSLLQSQDKSTTPGMMRLPTLLVTLLLLSGLGGRTLVLDGIKPAQAGVNALRTGATSVGSDLICEAADRTAPYALDDVQCALAQTHTTTENSATLQPPQVYIRSALRHDHYWYPHWLNLSVLEWQAGEHLQALEHAGNAAKRAPHDPRLLATYGWMAENAGELELAESIYRTLLEHNPYLRESTFFETTELRRLIVQDHQQYSFKSDGQQLTAMGWRHLNAGELEPARAAFADALALNARGDLPRIGLALSLHQLGEEERAWRHTEIALLGGNNDPRVLLAAGRIAYGQARDTEAARLLNQGWSHVRERNDSHRYYSIVYRRTMLPYDMVPGVIDPRLTADMATALFHLEQLRLDAAQPSDVAEISEFWERSLGLPE